jgi:hypothetical protein
MMKFFKYSLVLIISYFILMNLTSCKKYPDNDLWFKSPESAFTGLDKLTEYTVDGIDSMPMWDVLYNTGPDYNGYWPADPSRPFVMKDINFSIQGQTIDCYIGIGSFHFYNNKKYIYIYFKMDDKGHNLPFPKYNLFYNVESNWKILKLTKSGTLRIQRTYNNKVYEMQFD